MSDVVIRPATPDDWPAVAEMGARVFVIKNKQDDRTYLKWLRGWQALPNDPVFDWSRTRIAVVDGRIVSHVAFIERTLRYGQVEVRFGGVAGVCTEFTHQGRGYASTLMRDVLRQMADEGYPLSLLDAGAHGYYNRFGYTVVWPNRVTRFNVRDAQRVPEEAAAGYCIRPYEDRDLAALLALYETAWSAHALWLPRSEAWLNIRLDRTPDNGQPFVAVVEDPGGVVRGYSAGWTMHERTEVIAADRPAVAALLRHTADQFPHQPDKVIGWLDLPDTPTSRYAAQLCSVHYNTWAHIQGGWMARFVNIQAALDALRPEWVARLETLGVPGASDAAFEAGTDSVILHIGNSRIELSQNDVLPLLCGSWLPQDVDDRFGSSLDETEREILKGLFPSAIVGLAGLDWF